MSSDSAEPTRIARLVAVVAGIVGVALCVLVPLLPVKQTTATILWPQAPLADGLVSDITAPLVSGAPLALDVSIPCTAIATLPTGGYVTSGAGGKVLAWTTGEAEPKLLLTHGAKVNALAVRPPGDAIVAAFAAASYGEPGLLSPDPSAGVSLE